MTVIILGLLLSACNPKIVREVIYVDVPVKQHCVKPEDKNIEKPVECKPGNDSMFFGVKCIATDKINYENWGNRLNSVVEGCK